MKSAEAAVTEPDADRAPFLGDWILHRSITDHAAGRSGSFAGTASFRAAGAGVADYAEDGWLQMGYAAPLRATRRYLWLFGAGQATISDTAGGIVVTFPLTGTAPEVLHLCGADRYRARHDFSNWPAWAAVWRVSGPRKDYTLHSRWARD